VRIKKKYSAVTAQFIRCRWCQQPLCRSLKSEIPFRSRPLSLSTTPARLHSRDCQGTGCIQATTNTNRSCVFVNCLVCSPLLPRPWALSPEPWALESGPGRETISLSPSRLAKRAPRSRFQSRKQGARGPGAREREEGKRKRDLSFSRLYLMMATFQELCSRASRQSSTRHTTTRILTPPPPLPPRRQTASRKRIQDRDGSGFWWDEVWRLVAGARCLLWKIVGLPARRGWRRGKRNVGVRSSKQLLHSPLIVWRERKRRDWIQSALQWARFGSWAAESAA